MSKVTIQGDASGTGIFTIASPNSNTDRTLVLPDEAGTVLTSGTPVLAQKGVPAFQARPSATNLTSSVWSKINFTLPDFDTNSCLSSGTFTPNVAGYYQINAQVTMDVTTSGLYMMFLYKNGSGYKRLSQTSNSATYGQNGSIVVEANGSTDYFEIYVYQTTGCTQTVNTNNEASHFSGCLVRAA